MQALFVHGHRHTFGSQAQLACVSCWSSYRVRALCRAFLRHGVILFTRAFAMEDVAAFEEQMKLAQACIFAYAAVAEIHFAADPNGFPFTYKLHQMVCHMVQNALRTGHASWLNDQWVERMMRLFACRVVRYVCSQVSGRCVVLG
jgi:hypothetical protein